MLSESLSESLSQKVKSPNVTSEWPRLANMQWQINRVSPSTC